MIKEKKNIDFFSVEVEMSLVMVSYCFLKDLWCCSSFLKSFDQFQMKKRPKPSQLLLFISFIHFISFICCYQFGNHFIDSETLIQELVSRECTCVKVS